MLTKEKEVLLPISPQELDRFISGIIKDYKLPNNATTAEAIAVQILHLDNKTGRARRSFFADCAVKFLANKAAFEMIEGFKAAEKEAARIAGEQQAKELASDAEPLQNA